MRDLVKSFLKARGYQLRLWQPRPTRRLDLLPHLIRSLKEDEGTWPNVVQVGANDGQRNDPLVDVLSTGRVPAVLVEPVDRFYESLLEFHREREVVRCVRCAISEQDGERELFIIDESGSGPEYLGGLSTFDREVLMRHRSSVPDFESRIRSVMVPTKTPKTLMSECGFARVDVLLIDTEGFDSEVFRMFVEAGFVPRVVQLEHKHLDVETKRAVQDRLDSLGFSTLWGPGDVYAIRHGVVG